MKTQNSPRRYFPKIKPEVSAEDYIVSKQCDELDKLYPQFDDVSQKDAQSNLALLQIKLHQTEKLLQNKRKHLVKVRQNLDKQWYELKQKELSLRDNFKHFDTFVRENLEKRERAEKKLYDDRKLIVQRQAAIDDCTVDFREMQAAKSDMDKRIRLYRLYEEYLESVVERFPEFSSIPEVINRYLSLLNAKNYLAQLQEDNLQALENARSDVMKLIEEKNFIIMGLNNQIANLQARYENANIKSLECENLVIQIKNNAVKQMNEIDEVKSAIWNVYIHMAQSKKHPVKIKRENVEDQMMYIKRTLTELSKVNQILKKQSKGTPRARKKN